MSKTTASRFSSLAAVLILASLLLLLWGAQLTEAVSREAPPSSDLPDATWTRNLEPLVLTGADLPQFDAAPLDDLFVYAFDGAAWQQIPFQFDEVNASGTYTTEGGLLDSNDELTFMAMDLGQRATPSQWLADADSRNSPRFQVQVTNPLAPLEQGWVYVYRSSTLSYAASDYVNWDAADHRVVAGGYVAGFDPTVSPLMTSLELNSTGIDALDREKLRLRVRCYIGAFPYDYTATEEDLLDQYAPPAIDGAVRVGGGTTQSHTWYYKSAWEGKALQDMDLTPEPPCSTIELLWFQQSTDWLNPESTGMAPMTYYDNNTPSGVPVDGTPDSVPSSPFDAWREASGSLGSLVWVQDISVGSGTLTNYYKDDGTSDPYDTGDKVYFGDAGLHADAPGGMLDVDSITFILDPALPNVGEAYRSLFENPLERETTAQSYEPPCEPPYGLNFSWSPDPAKLGLPTTFLASMAGGTPPFEYEWTFGDDGSSADGNPVSHTFLQAGNFPVTVQASNACGQTAVSKGVTVECEPLSGLGFTWVPAVPSPRQVVTFTAEASGSPPIDLAWEFGDGGTAIGDVVTHTYALTGAFDVVLTADNPCDHQVVTQPVEVVCDAVSDTSLTWEPTNPGPNQPVSFQAEASGSAPLTFAWAFGDGATGQGPAVSHSYALTGTYTLALTATNFCGQEVVTGTLLVACTPLANLDFSWTPTDPHSGEAVNFTGQVDGTGPITYTWQFSDDGSAAIGKTVQHTFAHAGSFEVSLQAANPCSTAPGKSHTVQVQERPIRAYFLPLLLQNYPLPPGQCQELIVNGGFENNDTWYLPTTPRPGRYTTEKAHSGSRSVLLGLKHGEPDVYSWSSASQLISIPADAQTVTLSFWYYPTSDLDSEDYQEALLLDAESHVIATLMRINSNGGAWTYRSFDLTQYAGQSIKVYFNAYNDGDGEGVTGMYVDDVSVQACPVSPPPPAPDCYPADWGTAVTGNSPYGVALNSGAKRAYVANNVDDTLSIMDTQTYARIVSVAVGDGPNGVAYNPANDMIYVANSLANTVSVLRASDYGLVKTINVGSQPAGVAVRQAANRIYVANYGSDTVSIIDGATNAVVKTLSVGDEPAMVAINPNTGNAYVTLHGAGRVAVITTSDTVKSLDIYSSGPYGITVDTLRNLVYVATIESFRVVAIDGISDTYLGWVEIRKKDDGTPVPLRQIAVNPSIGSSGHVFVTTIGEDGGFDMFLMMAKGWPDFFERPVALGLDEGREGMVFEPSTLRVFATSLSGNLLKAFLDGEPRCPYNFSEDYQLTICVANPDGACEQTITR